MYTVMMVFWAKSPLVVVRSPLIVVREFNTEAEIEAYLEGVEDMNGWLSYEVILKTED